MAKRISQSLIIISGNCKHHRCVPEYFLKAEQPVTFSKEKQLFKRILFCFRQMPVIVVLYVTFTIYEEAPFQSFILHDAAGMQSFEKDRKIIIQQIFYKIL